MEATGHIQVLLRDRRRILSVRRANVRHEVRLVDLRRLPGKLSLLPRSFFLPMKLLFTFSKEREREKKRCLKKYRRRGNKHIFQLKKREEKLLSYLFFLSVQMKKLENSGC